MVTKAFPDELNLAHYFLLDRIAEGLGSEIALRFGAHTFTYDEVAARTLRTSTLLRRTGLPRGGRVLIVLRDVPAFAWVFFGALGAGGVVVMGNPDADAASLAYLARYTGASLLVTAPRVARELLPLLGDVLAEPGAPPGSGALLATFVVDEPATGDDPRSSVRTGELAGLGHAQDLELALAEIDPRAPASIVRTHRDEPAIWLFTSGSTGKPKAAMHAHRDFAFNTEVFAKGTVGVRRGDVHVSVPRLFFGYATGTNLMFPFAVGGSVGLFAERPTPESVIAAIVRYRPTVLTLVPTIMGKILDHDDACRARGEPGVDLSCARFAYSAGEALPASLLRRWRERFAFDIYDGIGSAEMFHIYASNRPGDIRAGSLGRAVDGYELRVLPEEADGAGATPVAAGEIGVLWVRGDSVAFGYWLDRDKSFETFHGRWCKTGDLFHVDADGYLYFDGRADDLLKVSGIFVAPQEVEECLLQHPAVSQAAVIGADDDGLLKPKALVVPKGDATAALATRSGREALRAELREHVKMRLAKHKYPRFVVFLDELPKNDRGKVDRKLLKEREARAELAEEP